MNNALFEKLPRRTQYAYALGLASNFLGRERVLRLVQQVAPLVQDKMGHGDGEPADNFWGGVWQVYVAD